MALIHPHERAHYSSKVVTLDRQRTYPPDTFKPVGLWYSAPCDGDGWEHWCRSNDWGNYRLLKHKHLLTLDLSCILTIRNGSEFDAFENSHGHLQPRGPSLERIDWAKLTGGGQYAGIEIAPYQWSRRLREGSTWYYPWDCASGCIWDLSAVLDWKLLNPSSDT